MFTQNYINMRRGLFMGDTFSYVDCSGAADTVSSLTGLGWSDIGQVASRGICSAIDTSFTGSSVSSYTGVFFGTGTTTPTREDYTLESPITSGLTITNGGANIVDCGDGVYEYVSDFLVRNSGESDIVISEIGVIAAMNDYGTYVSSSAMKWKTALLERQVLPTPISIPVGKSKMVTYKVTFNHG